MFIDKKICCFLTEGVIVLKKCYCGWAVGLIFVINVSLSFGMCRIEPALNNDC